MPKSKNKRKSGRKAGLKIPKTTPRPFPEKTATTKVTPAPAPRKKLSFRERLYANDALPLFEFLSVIPLFVATWIASGLVIENLPPFGLLTAMAIAAHYHGLLLKREQMVFARELHILFYAALALSAFGMFLLTKRIDFSVLTGVVALTYAFGNRLLRTTVRGVLLECLLVILRSSLLALLGISVQLAHRNEDINIVYAIFGFIPGMMLAASLIPRHTAVFEKSGWRRSFEHKKKDGSTQLRPGGMSRLFGLILMLGPALPLALLPFGLFPVLFFGLALPLYLITRIAESYFRSTLPDSTITVNTINLTAITMVLLLVIGILGRLL